MIGNPICLDQLNKKNVETLALKYRGDRGIDPKVERIVRRIVNDVAKRGDDALIEYTHRIDGVELNVDELRIDPKEFQDAYSQVSEEEIISIKRAKERIEQIEKRTFREIGRDVITREGVGVYYTYKSIESVGCYAPGGRAWYPSSLLMASVPAKIAGVHRIICCTPPSKSKQIHPIMLVAADLCGVREYYRVGGAQAIAALAYGTESIRPVKKVVGPGGVYVTAAKIVVSNKVAIDMPAGPSEVLIIADESAKAEFIARDMISQAEHGSDSVCGLITLSDKTARNVNKAIVKMLDNIQRVAIVSKAFREKGFILTASSIEEAIRFTNLFAPEHLEIVTEKPEEIVPRITSAGLILLGNYTPVAASDYCVGVNHILPTAGFAQTYSGLSVLDFLKRIGVVKCSRIGLQKISHPIRILSKAEGLPNHQLAMEERRIFG